MKNNSLSIYNIIFPIHLLLVVPFLESAFLFLLPIILFGNWIVDGVVLFVSLKIFHAFSSARSLLLLWVKVWLVGFLADFVAAFCLFGFENAGWYVSYEYTPSRIFFTGVGVGIAALIIFFCNKCILRKHALQEKDAFRVAFMFSLLTAPWLFFLPPIG